MKAIQMKTRLLCPVHIEYEHISVEYEHVSVEYQHVSDTIS